MVVVHVCTAGAKGHRLSEANSINKSLLSLRNVLSALVQRQEKRKRYLRRLSKFSMHEMEGKEEEEDSGYGDGDGQGVDRDKPSASKRSNRWHKPQKPPKPPSPVHIPYRSSKLTTLLSGGFGRNGKTLLLLVPTCITSSHAHTYNAHT